MPLLRNESCVRWHQTCTLICNWSSCHNYRLDCRYISNKHALIAPDPFCLFLYAFQVGRQLGRPLTVSAAARARRVSARVRVARPSTSSPLPAPRPNRKPAPPRRQWSLVLSPSNTTTSRLWSVPWRKDRPRGCRRRRVDGGRSSCALAPQVPATSWHRPRGNLLRRSWRQSRSCRNASRTSGAFGFLSASLTGRTRGSPISWGSIACESRTKQGIKRKWRRKEETQSTYQCLRPHFDLHFTWAQSLVLIFEQVA